MERFQRKKIPKYKEYLFSTTQNTILDETTPSIIYPPMLQGINSIMDGDMKTYYLKNNDFNE